MTDFQTNNRVLAEAIQDLTTSSCLFNDISGSSTNYSQNAIHNQLKIILSEVDELVQAFNHEAPVNVAAEAVDVVVTVVGLLQQLNNAGIDIPLITRLIGDKNLQKFPTDISLVNRSVSDYAEKGETITVTKTSGYSSDFYVLKDKNNKTRKPLGFKPVNLTGIAPEELLVSFPAND